MFNKLMEEYVTHYEYNILLLRLFLSCRYHAHGKSLEMYNRESERIKNLSEEELELNIDGIDWDSVAKNHVCTASLPPFPAVPRKSLTELFSLK